jgi:hypothetical protein
MTKQNLSKSKKSTNLICIDYIILVLNLTQKKHTHNKLCRCMLVIACARKTNKEEIFKIMRKLLDSK